MFGLVAKGSRSSWFLGTLVGPVAFSIMYLLDSLSFSHIKIGSNPLTDGVQFGLINCQILIIYV